MFLIGDRPKLSEQNRSLRYARLWPVTDTHSDTPPRECYASAPTFKTLVCRKHASSLRSKTLGLTGDVDTFLNPKNQVFPCHVSLMDLMRSGPFFHTAYKGFFMLVPLVWELPGHVDSVLLWASLGATLMGTRKGGQFGGLFGESMFQK